jgi:ribosomal protein S18 acetylase RimI-like enzyme
MIREITDQVEKSKIAEEILRALPNWFELEQGILDYKKSVKELPFFAVEENGLTIGFVAIDDINEFTSEIHVMGILPDYRGKGYGRQLIDFVWQRSQKLGKKYLIVKTLDESSEDKFYEETRNFYRAMNFLPIMTSKDIWGEENPCLVMLKST